MIRQKMWDSAERGMHMGGERAQLQCTLLFEETEIQWNLVFFENAIRFAWPTDMLPVATEVGNKAHFSQSPV